MTEKHGTASVFLFSRADRQWRVGLILHPRFGRLMIPGGHVEPRESPDEAARREVREETGQVARLVPPPSAPVPARCTSRLLAQPWWIAQHEVPADGTLAHAHVHLDHLYVALVDGAGDTGAAEHPFRWYSAAALAGLDMFDDARALATALLAGLAKHLPPAAAEPAEGAVRAALLAGLT